MEFRTNGIINKNLLLFALFDTLRTILENYVIIPPPFHLNHFVQKKEKKCQHENVLNTYDGKHNIVTDWNYIKDVQIPLYPLTTIKKTHIELSNHSINPCNSKFYSVITFRRL